MTTESEKPTELNIDVEQWKRDIQTFAKTTKQALHAIADELSGTRSPSSSAPQISNESIESQTSESNRLSKLKSELKERISRSA